MQLDKVQKFAISQGFSSISEPTDWLDYQVYEPKVNIRHSHLQKPVMILVKGQSIRLSTTQEALDYLDFKYPE